MTRWIFTAGLLGFGLAALIYGPRVQAQPQALATLYGCSNAIPTLSTCTIQPILVDVNGNVSVVGQ